MIIREINTADKYGDNSTYKIIVTDNKGKKTSLLFCDGEPEDNTLGRNFNDVYSIIDLLHIAYQAGKNGEELVIDDKN